VLPPLFCEKANESVNGEAGAGLVKVCATVQGKVTSVAIDKALLTPEKQQVIEDLTVRSMECHYFYVVVHEQTNVA
jgi:nucleoid-associated protein EbfC